MSEGWADVIVSLCISFHFLPRQPVKSPVHPLIHPLIHLFYYALVATSFFFWIDRKRGGRSQGEGFRGLMARTLEDADIAQFTKSFKKQHGYQLPRKQNLKQMVTADANNNPDRDVNAPTFSNIEATPSLVPAKKYCDITGLEAPYTDPKTKLRYHDAEVYAVVKHMTVDAAQTYLSLRHGQIILK